MENEINIKNIDYSNALKALETIGVVSISVRKAKLKEEFDRPTVGYVTGKLPFSKKIVVIDFRKLGKNINAGLVMQAAGSIATLILGNKILGSISIANALFLLFKNTVYCITRDESATLALISSKLDGFSLSELIKEFNKLELKEDFNEVIDNLVSKDLIKFNRVTQKYITYSKIQLD